MAVDNEPQIPLPPYSDDGVPFEGETPSLLGEVSLPSDELRSVFAESTPDMQLIAEVDEDETYSEADLESLRQQKKVDQMFPEWVAADYDELGEGAQRAIASNAMQFRGGDTENIVNSIKAIKKLGTDTSNILNEVFKGITDAPSTAVETFQTTQEGHELGTRSKDLVDRLNKGEISQEEFEIDRQEIALDTQDNQKRLKEIQDIMKEQGYAAEAINSAAAIAPSMYEVLKNSLLARGGTAIGARVVGTILGTAATGGVGAAIAWAPTIAGATAGFRAGQALEAGGIAHELLLAKDVDGNPVPAEDIAFFANVGGAISGSLEFAGALGGAAGAGVKKLVVGNAVKKSISKIATSPTLRRRLLNSIGAVSFGTVGEIGTEHVQNIVNAVASTMAKDRKADLAETIVAEFERQKPTLPTTARQVGPGMALLQVVGRTLVGSATKLRNKRAVERAIVKDIPTKIEEAEESRDTMETAVLAAQQSPLLQTAPEKLEEILGSEAGDVYLPIKEIKEHFEAKEQDPEEEVGKLFGAKAKSDYKSALDIGGDIKVSASALVVEAAITKDTELQQFMLDNFRKKPSDMSAKEASTVFNSETAQDATARKDAPTIREAQRKKVRERITKDLEKVFTEGVGEYNYTVISDTAEIMTEMQASMAEMTGLSIEEVDKRLAPFLTYRTEKEYKKVYPGSPVPLGFYSPPMSEAERGGEIAIVETPSGARTTGRGEKAVPDVKAIGNTYLHEMGHYVLTFLHSIYTHPDANEEFLGHAKDILEWATADNLNDFINADHDTIINVLTRPDEQGLNVHETFAEAMEAYFREGKAPTKKLEPAFGRMAQIFIKMFAHAEDIRLANGIRSFHPQDFMGVDERVRTAMDKLVVDMAEIDAELEDQDISETLARAGIQEDRIKEIVAERENAIAEYKTKVIQKALAKKPKNWKEREDFVKKMREDYVDGAYDLLVGGTMRLEGGITQRFPVLINLDTSSIDQYEEALKMFPSFGTVPALIAHLRTYEVRKTEHIRKAADKEFGSAVDETKLITEVYTPALEKMRLKLALWDYAVIKNEGENIPTLNRIAQTDDYKDAIREARKYVRERTIEDTDAAKVFNAAAIRFERMANQATNKQEILEAKRNQAFNRAFYMEANKIVELADKTEDIARGLLTLKDKLKKLPGETNEVAISAIDNAIERARELGVDVAQQAQAVAEGTGQKILPQYKGKEVENIYNELRLLSRRVSLVVHNDPAKAQEAAEKLAFDNKVKGLVKGIGEVKKGRRGPGPTRGAFRDDSIKEKITKIRRSKHRMAMALTKPEFMMLMMDLGKSAGKWWKAIYRPLDVARSDYLREGGVIKKEFSALVNKFYTKKDLANFGVKNIRAGNKMIGRDEAIPVLLNFGNTENRNRLLNMGINEQQAMEIFSQLDEKDFAYAEAVWEYIDSFWDRIVALEKETTGKAPVKVEAESFKVGDRTLRGGYYPIQYEREQLAERVMADGLEPDKLIDQTHFTGALAQTTQGHVQKRVKNVSMPLNLSMSIPLNHLNQVIYDLHFRKPVLEVAALLRDHKVRKALKDGLGEGAFPALSQWLRSVARDATIDTRSRNPEMAKLEDFLRAARRNTVFAMMGHSIRVATLQPLGLYISAKQLGGRNILKSMFNLARDPKLREARRAMRTLSPMMAERSNLFERDAYEYIKRRFPKGGWGVKKAYDTMQMWAFNLIGQSDMFTSSITWTTAFDLATQGKVENVNPLDMDAVVAYADQAVRITQGSGGRMDLSTFQAHSEYTKLASMFYSYFNTLYNQSALDKRLFKGGQIGVYRMARSAFYMYVLTSVTEEFLLGEAEEDEETAETMSRYGKAILANYLGMYPIIREFGGALKGYSPEFSPVASIAKDVTSVAVDTVPKVFDPDADFNRTDRKNILNSLGILGGLPSAQMNRTIDAVVLALEEDNMDILEFMQMISKGASREQRGEIKR